MNRTRGGCALLILAIVGVFVLMYPFSALGLASAIQLTQVYSGISMWLLVVLIVGVGLLLLAVNDVREAVLSLKDQTASRAPAGVASAHVKLTGVARECSACGAAVPVGAKTCSQCKAVFSPP